MRDRRRDWIGMSMVLSVLSGCGEEPRPSEQEMELDVKESAVCEAERARTWQVCNSVTWPGGVVNYAFDDNVPSGSATRTTVEAAMRLWELASQQRVRFVEVDKTNDRRLHIAQTPAGSANTCQLGYGPGLRHCTLTADAWTAAHELGHGLGLWHGQLRNDRDRYISVDDSSWPCAGPGANFYFDNWWKCGASDNGAGYGPFDFAAAPAAPTTRSVMMYVTAEYARRSDNQPMVGQTPALRGPEENDGTAVIEMYAPPAWRKSYARGRDVGATQPLDDRLMSTVTIAGAPAIAQTSCGNMDVYVRGSDNRLYHRIVAGDNWNTNNGGSLYASLSTQAQATVDSEPAASAAPDGSSKLVAARYRNNTYVRRFAGGSWSAWQSLSGPTGSGTACSAPALAQDRTEARVFVVACNGSLYERRRPNGNDAEWSAWTLVTGAPANDSFVERPAATASRAGQFEVFAVGTSGRLWHLSTNNGTWGSWVQRATGVATTSPAVTGSIYGDAGGRLMVFYRSQAAPFSRLMWSERMTNGEWTTPIAISGQYVNVAASMCSVIRTDVIGVMHDGFNAPRGIWHKQYWNP